MPECEARQNRHEAGFAVLMTALVLVLVALIAFTALRRSEQESTAAGRSRSTTRSIQAADAGVQLALSRLRESPPNLTAFDVDLVEGANMQSRTRTETSAQDLDQTGLGEPEEGYALNVGTGVSSIKRVFLVNVTAEAGGSTAEIEAKLGRSEVEATGY